MNPFTLQVSQIVHEERLQEAANNRALHQDGVAVRTQRINHLSRRLNMALASLSNWQKEHWGMPSVNPPAPDYPVIIF